MHIVFPILINLLLVGIFALTILFGKKLGWKASLTNLIITAGVAVGAYFFAQLPFMLAIHSSYFSIFSSINFNLIFASIAATTVYSIETFISFIICKKKSLIKVEALNTAKIKRAKAIDKKTEKILRKQEHRAEKASREYRKLTRKSRLFGALICIITGLLIICASYIQIKAACILIEQKTQIEWLDDGYIYTAPGQLEELIK